MRLRIIFCLLLAVALFPACKKEGKVIPRGKMAKIYAEMFVADQQIYSDFRVRRMTDTSFVYAPIFKKYGYTVDDYRASMEYYINDADRYARILRRTAAIIEADIKELKQEKELMELQEEKSADHFTPDKVFYMTGLDNPAIFQIDSLTFFVDTAGGALYFEPYQWEEKLFIGPEIVVSDEPEELEETVGDDTDEMENGVLNGEK